MKRDPFPRRTIGLCLLLLSTLMSLASAQAPSKELASTPGQTSLEQANLPAGVYEVNFRMQVDRSENSVTPLALLSVNVPDYPQVIYRQITPLNFEAAGTSQDFKFVFDNFKAQNVRVAVDLAQNKVAVPKLTIDRITLTPMPAPCIGTVWPGKILYHTGEAAHGSVSVYNGANESRSVTLRCTLESDLNRTRPLPETKLTLAAGERRDVPVTWNTGKEEFGFGLSAVLSDAQGKEISRGREYFSVSDNLWAEAIIDSGRGGTIPNGYGPNQSAPVSEIKKSEDLLAAELAKPIAPYWSYGNYLEFYAWAPDDFFNLAPSQDYWYSGTGNYTVGKKWLQLSIAWLHRRGMRATTYANPFSVGYEGDLVFQQHPEWFQYDQSGQPVIGTYYQKKLEAGRAIGGVPPWPMELVPYGLWINVNIARLDAIDAQTEQIIKSSKMFGWDGVRFDNGSYSAVGYNSDGKRIDGNDPQKKEALGVRAWARMRDGVHAKLGPNFAVGDNGDYELCLADLPIWNEVCSKGGLLMEEVPRNSWSAQSPHNRWHDYMSYYAKVSGLIHAQGGHHLIIGLDYQNPVDHLYLNVFTYAVGAHPYGNYHSQDLPLGNYAQFATRYSSLIWDINRLKPLADPEKKINVTSTSPVWWKELASTRQTSAGKQYIVHLVNPPVQERIYTDATNQVPPALQNVEVTLQPDQGEKISRAWVVSADPVTHQTELPVTTSGGRVSVTVPKVAFWSIVVFE